jgi:hypothetical protein
MVRSSGTVFAVLGAALFTAACSSSSSASSAGQVLTQMPSQAQKGRDPLAMRRPAAARTPARTTAPAAVARASSPAPRSAPVSRGTTTASAPSRCALAPTPAPAPRTESFAMRSVNGTCPVLIGTPVDPSITTRWKGSTIAFSSTTARLMWETDPARYSANVAGLSGSAGDSAPAFARMAPAAGPAAASGTIVTTNPAPGASRVLSGASVASPAVAPAHVAAQKPAVVAGPAAAPAAHADDECEDCPGGVCRVPGR